MVNIKALKCEMRKRGYSVENLAKAIGIDKATLYRRINGNGVDFTMREANEIIKTLGLTAHEGSEIFFNENVADKRQIESQTCSINKQEAI